MNWSASPEADPERSASEAQTDAHAAYSYRELRSADRIRMAERMAAIVAHDLGSPLNVVSGRAMLVKSLPDISDEVKTHVQSIAEQAERMAALLRETLAALRDERSQHAPWPLSTLAEAAVNIVQPTLRQEAHTITIVGDHNLHVEVDYLQTLQTLTALLEVVLALTGSQVPIVLEYGQSREPIAQWHHAEYAFVRIRSANADSADSELFSNLKPLEAVRRFGRKNGLTLSMCNGMIRAANGALGVDKNSDGQTGFLVLFPQRGEK